MTYLSQLAYLETTVDICTISVCSRMKILVQGETDFKIIKKKKRGKTARKVMDYISV